MDFKEYQKQAVRTLLLEPGSLETLYYLTLGLANEAGEVAGVVKKYIRGDYPQDEVIDRLESELGDVLWYLAVMAEVLGISLNDIAVHNIAKLQSRQERGVLRGDGDNR